MSTPPIPPRRSSVGGVSAGPSTGSGPTIPVRSSSIRRKLPWRPTDAKRSRDELECDLKDIDQDISKKAKKLKPSTSYDSDFWTANAEISHLCQLRAGMRSRLEFLDYKETSHDNVSDDDWQANDKAQNLEREVLAYRQAEELAKKQSSRFQGSRTGLSAIFFKLFTSSPQGLNINNASVGRRETDDQSNMRMKMKEKYCPDAPEGLLWDPIGGRWEWASIMHAAHLYAWRQVESMDIIFGSGAKAEIFSPENGLFLGEKIEKALDQGLIAIVPNVDLEPKDKDIPRDDLADRNQRLRDWEKSSIKEYKVVVLDRDNKRVKDIAGWRDGDIFKPLAALDERPLKFHTNFRPRARYVWWTFMNAILQTAWRQKQNEKNVLRQEVAKATRYWGTRGRYVKKNMLRGFVDELGQDIESILENAIEEDDTGDTGEVGLDVVAVMVSETVFRTEEAAKEDKEDEDESEDEDSRIELDY